MLFTVSTKPVLSVVFSNVGSTKNVPAFGFGQNTQINLITCRNVPVGHIWKFDLEGNENT